MVLPNANDLGIHKPKDEPYKQSSWYLVEVSYNMGNPIHKALMFTGFLYNGFPGSYSTLIAANGASNPVDVNKAIYIKPIRLLYEEE